MSRSDDHFALSPERRSGGGGSANTDVSLLKGETNLATARASNITAPTQFIAAKDGRYAYRRFGAGSGLRLMCLQHFTGTLDNWDPAVCFSGHGRRRSGIAADVVRFEDGKLAEHWDVL
jgi:hypothetical protein